MKRLFRLFNNLFSYINYGTTLVSTVKQLEKDVENLENKLLAPENDDNFYSFPLMYPFYNNKKPRAMSLEEKVNALATALKVTFEWTEEKEKEVIAKIPKKKKKKDE